MGRLQTALEATSISGIETNLPYLRSIARAPAFAGGGMTTRGLEKISFQACTIEVVEGGTLTTVQDMPGRLGYWAVGIPPSGPMDARAFALANAALGNPPDAAGLEITVSGPTLRFDTASLICLSGAAMSATLDGCAVAWHVPIAVPVGAVLRIGGLLGPGCRAYLAVQGGIDVPLYLGSRSTFTLGRFGGHGGRALRTGDILHVAGRPTRPPENTSIVQAEIGPSWQIAVHEGPHAAPDFFTEAGIEAFYAAEWEVHYNSSRTGIRLIGPKPEWARQDGGEAGLHPSNIHDTPYAVGAVDFTGDMPVILGPDGPSLGGFVCPCTITTDELWKIGQLRPGDRVRFRRLPGEAVLHRIAAQGDRPATVYRRSGDACILVEYGPPVLDLELRARAHALMQLLEKAALPGVLDITPGIRSLQVHVAPAILPLEHLLPKLVEAEDALPALEDMEVESRIVHLPLCWDDSATQAATAKYMQTVRADAPWCPSNIEFIRRINGLATQEDVKRIVFDASYLVMGLGDVYLGAPVAMPLDPRHRLVTTKYNPARTYTPENAVGIGGAYLCIYGLEGPGGYQFVGRTCQVWNSFASGTPWLLRFFDRLRFYEVSEAELAAFRADFPHGCAKLNVQPGTFRLTEYRQFLAVHAASIAQWKEHQQAAFEAERARWAASALDEVEPAHDTIPQAPTAPLATGEIAISSPVSGSVWRVAVAEGVAVQMGDVLVVVESMKTEIGVTAPASGTIKTLLTAEGRPVRAAQPLLTLQTNTP